MVDLGDRDVAVMLARSDALGDPAARAAAEAILDDADRAHVARFRFPHDRDVALASRALQRRALSACAPAIAPAAWRFAVREPPCDAEGGASVPMTVRSGVFAGAHGRPVIDGPPDAPRLAFSAANTRGLVGCAVATADREVGLDLEPWRDDAPAELIDRYFAPAERAALAALPAADRPRRFVELWVLKEAYLKARGVGLGAPLDHVVVALDAGPPRLVLDPALADDAASWQLALWSPTPGHAAAVCVRAGNGPPLTIHHRWGP